MLEYNLQFKQELYGDDAIDVMEGSWELTIQTEGELLDSAKQARRYGDAIGRLTKEIHDWFS